MSERGVPVAYRKPFDLGKCWVDERPPGDTILDIVLSVPDLPDLFLRHGVVCINGEVIPRDMWARVKPKPTCRELPIAVTMHYPLQGGLFGGGGGRGGGLKSVLSIVAAIALVVITAGAASGAIGTFLGISAIGPGTLGATLLAGAIGIAGSLAVAALSPPPTVPEIGSNTGAGATDDTNTDQKEAAGASGNLIDPGGAVPRVLGTRKVFPPLVFEPLVELVGEDEYVEAAFALNGPHLLTDVRVQGVSISAAEDIQYETREGWSTDSALTLTRRQARTITPQVELSTHKVLATDTDNLVHSDLPAQDLPVWHGVASRSSPDEMWMHLVLPSGLGDGASVTAIQGVPLRIRMRQRGDSTWINLPEVHLAAATFAQLRKAILFKWTNNEPGQVPVGTQSSSSPGGGEGSGNNGTIGFVYANINVPAQTASPDQVGYGQGWVAHSYFDRGGGNDYINYGNENASAVQHINLYDNRVEVYLNPTVFPKGIYEVEIKRGMVYTRSNFTDSSYQYSGAVKDLFYYSLSSSLPVIVKARANMADRIVMTRFISVWNEYPIQGNGFALIAIRAKNRSVGQLSVIASGYVRDYQASPDTSPDQVGWTNWTTTSNPAPHYRDVLSGAQNIDPLPNELRDDTGLLAWRTACATNQWTCDAIIGDMRIQDVLSLLASCGYARPYQSDIYGVTLDTDKSGEAPVQVFSRVNATNLRFERSFARVPDGFLVTYRSEVEDDDRAQLTVYQRDRTISTTGMLESISFDGLIDSNKVAARAQFDLDQANLRSTFYYLDTDMESIVCRKGDLVALQHDMLTSRAGDGRVKSKVFASSPDRSPDVIVGLILDSEVPITAEDDMHAETDMHSVTDMHLVGITTGIAIRRKDGTISTHALSNSSGSTNTLTFTTPIASTTNILGFDETNYEYGTMVVVGDLSSEYIRLLVAAIKPTKDLKASLVMVDEAQDLVRYGGVGGGFIGSGSPDVGGTGYVPGFSLITTPTSSDITVPPGVTSLTCEVWGAGGSGGAGGAFGGHCPGGGGGGYSIRVMTVVPGQHVYFRVGAGANGSGSSAGNGGQSSWINVNSNTAPTSSADGVLANGGSGGGNGSMPGGTGQFGTTNFTGGTGNDGSDGTQTGGGGGGGAGSGGAGGNASGSTPGTGGSGSSPDIGPGGDGSSGRNTSNATSGLAPGGGGGGSWFGQSGNGANGQIRFSW